MQSAEFSSTRSPPRGVRAAILVIVAAIALAWSHSLDAPFVLDDHDAILGNASLRSRHPAEWFFPDANRGETTAGRPLLNLSFVFNYALGGVDARGYRLTNVLIHAASALLLFGLVRRTAAQRLPRRATGAAFVVALLWAVHPLQTAAITYLAQRAESMAALWVLLTLYAFARGSGAAGESVRSRWFAISVIACLCGVATKETAATAPLLVLLYDRAFVSGSWTAAWRARRGYYLALMASWLLLAALVVASGGRGGSAGFDSAIGPGDYFLTQCEALMRYLTLVAWPAGQVFDYGAATVAGFGAVGPQCLLLAVLASGAAWALWRNRVAGFLGASFFLLLAPSSSFVPVATQTMAEHRMYLALAVPLAAFVFALGRNRVVGGKSGIVLAMVVAAALATATWRRNEVYRSEVSLWRDTVAKRPANPRAHYNLGLALLRGGDSDAAAAEFREAVRRQPNHAFGHFQLGTHLLGRGEWRAASQHLRAALAADPEFADAQANLAAALRSLGSELGRTGDLGGAAEAYQEALRVGPPSAETHFAWGNLLARSRRIGEAQAAYRAALAIDPDHVPARANLANALLVSGQLGESVREYEEVLRRQPENAAVRENLQLARQMQQQRR